MRRRYLPLKAGAVIASLFSLLMAAAAKPFAGPLGFVENKGQWPSHVRFVAMTESGRFAISQYGFSALGASQIGLRFRGLVRPAFEARLPQPYPITFIQRKTYHTKAYAEVFVRGRKGISVRYYLDNGRFRYDYIIGPGTPMPAFFATATGARKLKASGSTVVATTFYGKLQEGQLAAYQLLNEQHQSVPCRFQLHGNRIGVRLAHFDRGKQLVIDPLVFSTYIGDTEGTSSVAGVAVDTSGNVVVAGSTQDAGFPTTCGAYERQLNDNGACYISKFSPDGSTLLFCTFFAVGPLGGGGSRAAGLALDSSGDPVLIGGADEANFPTTPGAFQPSPKGSSGGMFVSKLSADGSKLLASTYLGGSGSQFGQDQANGITVDSTGNFVITGQTWSTDFPTTSGAYQATLLGTEDAFVTKVSADATHLIYSTYIGGSGYVGKCWASAIALDPSGDPVVVGTAASSTYPSTPGSVEPVYTGAYNAFVTKLSPDGSKLIYSTFLGNNNYGDGVAVDSTGAALVVGRATGPLNTTPGAFMTSRPSGYCVFLAKIDPSGSTLDYCTFFGGNGATFGGPIALGPAGKAVISGYSTQATTFPTTTGSVQSQLKAGHEVFVTEFAADGSNLVYSTLLGGSVNDEGRAVAVDGFGNFIVAGNTNSSDFPTTQGAYSRSLWYPQAESGFVASINPTPMTLAAVQPGQSSLQASKTGYATIRISEPAVGSGQPVNISATGPLRVPSSILIPPGQSAKNVYYTGLAVSSNTTATITATIDVNKASASVVVTPPPLTGFSTSPISTIGGNSVIGRLTIPYSSINPSSNTSVSLGSSSSAVSPAASVSITAGTNYVFFHVPSSPVDSNTNATLTATLGSSQLTANVTVTPAPLSAFSLTSTVEGGKQVLAHYNLNGKAGPSGSAIALSSASSLVLYPATATVPAGSNYLFQYYKTSPVAANTVVTIAGSLNGVQKTASVTLTPPAITSFTFNVSSQTGGKPVLADYHLDTKAPSPGVKLSLVSSPGSLQVPSSVTVPAGQAYLFVYFQTSKVSSSTPVTVTVSDGTNSKQATVTLTP